MRAGILISAVSHVVLVALALLGTPKLFDNPPLETIEVDLVRPEDVEPPKEPEKKPAGREAGPLESASRGVRRPIPDPGGRKPPRRRQNRGRARPLRPSRRSGLRALSERSGSSRRRRPGSSTP